MIRATPCLQDWQQASAACVLVLSCQSSVRASLFLSLLFHYGLICMWSRLPGIFPPPWRIAARLANPKLGNHPIFSHQLFFLIGLLSPAQLSSTSGLIGMEFVGLFLKLKVSKLWLSGCISPPVWCSEISSARVRVRSGSEHAGDPAEQITFKEQW